jgi:hypothetical protein
MDTEEEVANGAEQGTFACFVGSIDYMKIAALNGKGELQIGKGSEGRNV